MRQFLVNESKFALSLVKQWWRRERLVYCPQIFIVLNSSANKSVFSLFMGNFWFMNLLYKQLDGSKKNRIILASLFVINKKFIFIVLLRFNHRSLQINNCIFTKPIYLLIIVSNAFSPKKLD